jgi:hypothetical protein
LNAVHNARLRCLAEKQKAGLRRYLASQSEVWREHDAFRRQCDEHEARMRALGLIEEDC